MDASELMAYRIHQKRTELGMTMEELGQKVGVKSSAVNKWEKGIVSNIPRNRIQKLAAALECDPVWLMGIDKPEVPEYTPGSVELLELYSSLTEENRNSLKAYMRFLLDSQ